ncbi:MAG: XRE family transcriptional regulator [Sphingobacteriales bacterium]|nr:MAG: XRE family transcriptional regulator [Sphingobacteriales bacterium]
MKEDIFLKEMGKKIKAAREAKGLYLRDLGKMCNIHYGAICEIEKGKRNSYILTLKKIADKLDVDVKDFL